MLTAAVRDLHAHYPGCFVTDVRTPCPPLWENNPHLTPVTLLITVEDVARVVERCSK